MSFTWSKGRQGDWLVRGPVGRAGRYVDVEKKNGGTSQALLDKQIWSKDGVALYTVIQKDRSQSRRRYRSEDGDCHTDGNCSSTCNPKTCPCGETCPCGDGWWFSCG